MTDKKRFLRSYEIRIQNPSGMTFTVKPPLSVHFSVERNTLASANKCSLVIYNLGQKTRAQLYKDRYKTSEYWQIVIKAGYVEKRLSYNFNISEIINEMPIVFQGNIYECSSQKKGNVWETSFDCFDGGFGIQNGFTNQTYSKGTDIKTMIKNTISNMPNLLSGAIGNITEDTSMRGQTFFGKSSDVLGQMTEGKFFVDNEKVNVLNDNEVIEGPVIVIDSSLLRTTPKKRDTFLDCDLNFFPEAEIGKICELKSKESMYNGQYKIMGFSHNVDIKGDSCGEAMTTINLYLGEDGLQQVV